MSPSPSQPASAASETQRLQRELADKTQLVQDIRKDLIQAQISILELHDTIMQKETDKADAVAILGQLEHHLEQKVNYIMELDRVLNAKISDLGRELDATKQANARVVEDLVQKLDAANREIGATHELAAGFARDLAAVRDQLARESAAHAATTRQLQATETARASLDQEAATMRASLSWRLTRPFRALRRLLP